MKTKLLHFLMSLMMMTAGMSLVSAQVPCTPGQVVGCCPCTGCAPITVAPPICLQQSGAITVPITNGFSGGKFNDIAAVSLKLDFDPTVLQFTGISPTFINGTPLMVGQPNGPGSITISWVYAGGGVGTGWSLLDGAPMFNLQFNFLIPGGGVSPLNWDLNQCAYSSVTQVLALGNDILCQTPSNYVNGRVSLLTVWVSEPLTTCVLAPLQLIGHNSTTLMPYTYKWTGAGASWLNSTTISNPYFTCPIPGSYVLTYTVTDAYGCQALTTITVLVKANPTCSISGPDAICGLTTNAFTSTVLPEGGTVTHSWSISGDGTISGPADGATVTVIANASGSFTISDLVNRNGCAGWCSKTVTVNPNPTCSIDGPGAVCGGTTNTHNNTVLPAGGTVTHSWSITGDGSIVGSITSDHVHVLAGASGSYTVTDNIFRNGCWGTCSKTVIVNPNPVCSIDGPEAVCIGTTTVYTSVVTPLEGTVTHAWTITGHGTITGPTNLATVSVFAVDDGLFVLTDHISRNGCNGICIRTITVLPTPNCDIDGPNAVCDEAITTFTNLVTPALGTVTHSWTITGCGTITGTGQENILWWTQASVMVIAGPVPVGAASCTYTITDNFTREGCPATCSKTITVNAEPTCTISGPTAVCGGLTGITHTSTILPAGGTVTHNWSITGNGTITSGTTGASITVTAGATGSYTVTDNNSRNGCPGSCSKTVTVNPIPSCTIDGPDNVCYGSTNVHTDVVLPVGGTVTHNWSISGAGTIVGTPPFTGSSITVLASGGTPGTTYTVRDDISRNGCTSFCTKIVTVKPIPSCSISGPDSLCGGSSGTYTSTVSPTGGTVTHFWSITSGNGTINGANCNPTVLVVAGASGTFTLCDAVTRDGCASASPCCKTVKVNQIPSCNITGPNPVCGYTPQMGAVGPYLSTVTPNTGIITHSWSITGNGAISGSVTGPSVMVVPGTSGSFTLCDNITRNGCVSSCCLTVTVNPNPTCTIDGPAPVCSGSTGNVYSNVVLPAGGTVTHSWSITGNGTITSGLTGSSITVTASTMNTDGSFTVTDNITRNGCPGVCSKTVVVNATPLCSIAGPDPVCGGSLLNSYTATETPAGGTVTHSWTITGDGVIDGTASAATVKVDAGLIDGTFTITDNITRNGCTSSCSKTVTVHALPTCSISGADSVCGLTTNTYTVTINPTGGPVTHDWDITGDGTISGPTNTATVTVIAGASGSFTITDEFTRYGCPGLCSKTVIVPAIPVLQCASLQYVIGQSTNWILMNGTCQNYNLCLDSAVPLYFFDINALTSTVPLKNNYLNPFFLTHENNPVAFFAYWAAKGVISGATGWQGQMWLIINGNAPFFYVKKVGTDYKLIDGLQYFMAGNTGEPMLQVPGDYPPDTYTYTGTIKGRYNDCTSLPFPVNMTFWRNPACHIYGDDFVCPLSTGNVYTAPANLSYHWTITGNGTIVGSAIQQTVSVTATGAGSFTLCLTLTNPQTLCYSYCCRTVTVVYRNLSGKMTYPNCYNTVLNNIGLGLVPVPGTTPIQTTTTDANGLYAFTNLCAGDYTIIVTQNNKGTGGINSTDAAQILVWPTTGTPIQHARFLSGDVASTLNFVAANDALRVQQNFISGTPFTRGPWSYWIKDSLVATNLPAPALTWSVRLLSSADLVNINLLGLVTGDFNQSFIPGSAKTTSDNLELNYRANKNIKAGQEFDLPLYATSAMEVSAISLILDLPSNLVEVKDVVVKGTDSPVSYSVKGNELRISWYSEKAMNFAEADALVTLKLKTTSAFVEGTTFRVTLVGDPLNELADAEAIVIPHAQLDVDVVANSPVGINDQTSKDFSLNCRPNPFRDYSTLSYVLPENGEVTLEIMNMVGQVITTCVQETQESGIHSVKLASTLIPNGIYMAVLKVKTGTDELVKTIKIVVNK